MRVPSARPRWFAALKGSSVLLTLGVAAGAAVLVAAPASAQGWRETTSPTLGAGIGTGGLTLEFGVDPWDDFGVRLGIGWFPYEPTIDEEDVRGRGFFPGPILRMAADFFPFGGTFHLSAGIHHYSDGASARVTPFDSVEIGDREYSPEEVGEASVRVWGRETAPYLGLGWRRRTGRVRPFAELGVAFTGSPGIEVTVTGTARNDPVFMSDLEEEIREREEDLSSFWGFPHLSLGLRFPLFR